MPVVESDFARELFEDVKYARRLAQQNIRKAQKQQKNSYDRATKEATIKVNDLVMLKVEPRFKLDRTFRGPYRVIELTATNVVIRPVSDPLAEPWNVSIQRVSKCSEELLSSTPWFGYSGKNRKRRQIRRPTKTEASSGELRDNPSQPQPAKTTRRGRVIHRPMRYCLDAAPQGTAKGGGGSCKAMETRNRDQKRIRSCKGESREPRSGKKCGTRWLLCCFRLKL